MDTQAERIHAELYDTFIRDTLPDIPLHRVTLDSITTDTLCVRDLNRVASELEPLGYQYHSHGTHGACFILNRPVNPYAPTVTEV